MGGSNKCSQTELSGRAKFLEYAKGTLKNVCACIHTHLLTHTCILTLSSH